MATEKKDKLDKPRGRPAKPYHRIDASFEDILKAVVTPIKKD